MKTAFAACCLSVLLYAAQADFKWNQQDAFGGTDIGVHKLELFRKNGPEDIDAARRKRNVLYYGTIGIGTPPQNLSMCFDTGSASMWVPSMDCTTNSCQAHNRYTYINSSSFTGSDAAFTITYKRGIVQGNVGADTLSITDSPIVITNQTLGLTTASTLDFTRASCDGIFGLALPALAKDAWQMPAFFRMAQQGILRDPVFSVWLDPNSDAVPAGEVLFGGADATKFEGHLVLVPVISKKHWVVPMDNITLIGNKTVELTARQAVLDTGSSVITASTVDANTINSNISGLSYSADDNLWTVDGGCSNLTQLGNVTITLGRHKFLLRPDQYVLQVYMAGPDGNRELYCISAIVGGGPAFTLVLGANFHRAYYTVYEYDAFTDTARVALAPAKTSLAAGYTMAADETALNFTAASNSTAASNGAMPYSGTGALLRKTPLDTTNSTDTVAQAPQAATSVAGASLGALIQGGQQSGPQSSASDINLETAQQDAWQLFQQGNSPMYDPQENTTAPKLDHGYDTVPAQAAVPKINHGYGNAMTQASASMILSQDINGGDKALGSQEDDTRLNH